MGNPSSGSTRWGVLQLPGTSTSFDSLYDATGRAGESRAPHDYIANKKRKAEKKALHQAAKRAKSTNENQSPVIHLRLLALRLLACIMPVKQSSSSPHKVVILQSALARLPVRIKAIPWPLIYQLRLQLRIVINQIWRWRRYALQAFHPILYIQLTVPLASARQLPELQQCDEATLSPKSRQQYSGST